MEPEAVPSPLLPSPSVSPVPTTPPTDTAAADEVVALVNAERLKVGCAAVRSDETLRGVARAHSVDMATRNFFSHTGSDNSSPVERMRRAGYPDGLSENVARRYGSPQQVVRGWLGSAEHRRNMLNCDARAVGVGLAFRGRTSYWTQKFGRS